MFCQEEKCWRGKKPQWKKTLQYFYSWKEGIFHLWRETAQLCQSPREQKTTPEACMLWPLTQPWRLLRWGEDQACGCHGPRGAGHSRGALWGPLHESHPGCQPRSWVLPQGLRCCPEADFGILKQKTHFGSHFVQSYSQFPQDLGIPSVLLTPR